MEKFNIQIDKPCAEDFKTFTKTVNGGYCNSCQKNVVDFTAMSDDEILNYFSTEKSKTCGLFLESQLKSYSPSELSSKSRRTSWVSSLFGLSLVSLLSLTHSYAQEKTNTPITKESVVSKKDNASATTTDKITVTGTVSDKLGPLAKANIYLKNQNIGTQTDADGKFIFPKKLEAGDVLLVSYMGYKNKEIKVISENHSLTMISHVTLENSEIVMMGEVATNKVYHSKRTFFQRIKSLFTNE
ncbi:carboxypeptidase-like regulatory domain-containing protein [Flavobacterium aciduliphilum]|uniref:Carboxypeptidase-like protein n=1 Tax=Flavobacterium aciduliphilum TaxID=1101402 RepID=A0A328YIF4_9FLAO|nr:carboxypeptidase-like regulatory domain-containing protein [Flavobacterium aciduliphilum]RAR73898.1 carboxypeptidase-like protein [Flavobacterium aciduliphilum]